MVEKPKSFTRVLEEPVNISKDQERVERDFIERGGNHHGLILDSFGLEFLPKGP
jgi:hypothetical protein